MKVLVSGGSGLVGRYIVNGLLQAGYDVVVGGRTPPPPDWFILPTEFTPLTLDAAKAEGSALAGVGAFVHAAFDHVPGKYRGGEGDDPATFRRRNLDGTVRLFEIARQAGVRRVVFLSSRAVYDGHTPGELLREDVQLAPASLYGETKLRAEQALAALSGPGFTTASLRLTGVYGHIRPNKWDALFADYLAGLPVPRRAGSEVHGSDVALAVRLMLEADAGKIGGHSFNVSDIITDSATILAPLKALTGCRHPLPPSAPFEGGIMATEKIRSLGWRSGGLALLNSTLEDLSASYLKNL